MGLHHHTGTLFAAGMFIVISTAHAEEDRRELGPHVHGHGTLAIAFEANNVQMELAAPGMDIVGFEHEAETAEQKSAVETALADLKEPLKLFALPDSAGCTVTSADVKVVAEEHEDHHTKVEAGEAAGSEEHEAHHTEFRATYALACVDTAQASWLDFPFFDRFAGSGKLGVTVVDANGQTAFEVSREARYLER
ncbi:DUF2796 domain-containing protein [Mesorhizobium sp. BR1-1-6]|uniref:DUF2796 domain-containing protein n=1 Tax=unclassified Mesorhizobium TaxID=325217 RepID=UPI00112D4743|nr:MULTISPECIES: DUF2796 domain-containing protein [unclassified Mesorhizobium]MBZ9898161.1 DUF2796 domain-containing protein [Mesorhizobium sp. BR1-1-6]TPN45878.1 DUF2796 domain-containing protein [Mesorhizobium sp. B1-1-4]